MTNPILQVQLLGGFHLAYDNVSVIGAYPARLQSILAYLILQADLPQSRQHLAFLLWPDTLESRARNNLRQFLHQLRQVLPTSDRFLVADTNTVYWKTDGGQVIDTQLFADTLQAADEVEQLGDLNRLRSSLERAVAYYQGDLLPSCYDEWIAPVRAHLRQQCTNAYQRLLRLLEAQHEYSTAIQVAQQLRQLDPLDEDVYVALVRLHGLNEDRVGARRIYQCAVEILQRELGVEPSAALRVAYEQLAHTPRLVSPISAADNTTSAYTLVGRHLEWQALQACWQRARTGGAHLALITGEAGIGKSRLAEELFNGATRQGFTTAYTRAYGAEGHLSLAPVTEWLRSRALRPHLAALDPVWLTEIARLLPELLTENSQLARPEPITEYGRRQRFFEALARSVLVAPPPLLLWIDDLQWCDQETLEWLHFLLRFAPPKSLLILGTVRSEESPPHHPVAGLLRQLQAEARVSVVELAPLDAAETAKLAVQVQGHAVDLAATMNLYRETQGNPLFVVETVRAVMSGALPAVSHVTPTLSDPHPLPPRVYAVIGGRLAQLSPAARKVAEIGAAVGRAFTFDLLVSTGYVDEESAVQALDELWQRRIVREQQANLFDFTHDKLREVAYAEISAPQRRFLHRRIAQALETVHAEHLDPVSGQIAVQYEQAGMFVQAIPYYQQAGSMAAGVYANQDAVNLLTRGLTLLSQLPPGSNRSSQELRFQVALAPLFSITKGWASVEVERASTRALVLCNEIGDDAQRLKILYSLQSLYLVRARYDKVLQLYAESKQLSLHKYGPSSLPYASAYAHVLQFMGQLTEAGDLFAGIVAIRHAKLLKEIQESHGLSYLVLGHVTRSHILWCLGYPEAALASIMEAEHAARDHGQPFDHAFAMAYWAMLQEWSTDSETFRKQAEVAYGLTREYQTNYYHAWSAILVQFVHAWQQPNAENIAHLRTAIHTLTATGARLRLPYYFSLLARACLKAGHLIDAQAALEQAQTESQRNNEHWWDAELYRLHGELSLAQGADSDTVEAAYSQAIEIAQAQQAKSLELRAALSLARLWQSRGRASAAKQFLVPLYGWFTEGFDTIDLQAARALIAQL